MSILAIKRTVEAVEFLLAPLVSISGAVSHRRKIVMRYVTVCLLVAFVLVFAGVSLVGTQEWSFEGAGSDEDWEPITGDWSVQDGEYSQDELGIRAMRSLAGDENWANYTVEADIQITGNSYAGLIFRAANEFEYYVFYMNASQNCVEWWEHTLPNAETRTKHFKHTPEEITIVLYMA